MGMSQLKLRLLDKIAEGELTLRKLERLGQYDFSEFALQWDEDGEAKSVTTEQREELRELWRDGFLKLYDTHDPKLQLPQSFQDSRVVEVRPTAQPILWEYALFGWRRDEFEPTQPTIATQIMDESLWAHRGGVLTLPQVMLGVAGTGGTLSSVRKALHWLIAPNGPLEKIRSDDGELYRMRNTCLYYLHGDEPDSDLLKKSTCNGDSSNALEILSDLERIQTYRIAFCQTNSWREFRPDQNNPKIFVVVDHYENIFPLAPERFADLGRLGRHTAIHLCAVARTGDISEFHLAAYGNSDDLRSYCDNERVGFREEFNYDDERSEGARS